MLKSLRVALVHDWLTGMRGGERVLEVFADLFPNAPIYTLVHAPGSVSRRIESHPIHYSALQRVPKAARTYRYFLPLLPTFAERIKIAPCDLVLSTSSCVAKGIVPPNGSKHASYIFSPMRYLYDRYDDYFGKGRAGLLTRAAMRLFRGRLARWDKISTDRIDSLVGISTFVVQRIEQIYGRSAPMIFPPVEVDRFATDRDRKEDYYLIVSALAPYKGIDLALEAFRRLDRRLIVAGDGPLFDRLAASAPTNVELLGWVDDDQVVELVQNCRAFVFPNVEDFGIAPVEAMAAGKPAIALGQGGALDTVRDLDRYRAGLLGAAPGPTGLFFSEPTSAALAAAIGRFEREEAAFIPSEIASWARRFDRPRFEREICDWLESVVADRRLASAA